MKCLYIILFVGVFFENDRVHSNVYSDFLNEYLNRIEIQNEVIFIKKRTNMNSYFQFDSTSYNELKQFYFTGYNGNKLVELLETQSTWKNILIDFNEIKHNRQNIKLNKDKFYNIKYTNFPKQKSNYFFTKKNLENKHLFEFSDIAFSKDFEKVIFYINYHRNHLEGVGCLVLMKKINGVYKIELLYEDYVS